MAFKSTMDDEGVLQLSSIREILELAGLKQAMRDDDIIVKFHHDIPVHRTFQGWWQDEGRFNLVNALDSKMCPVVTVRNPQISENFIGHSFHAVVAIGHKHIYGEEQEC